MKRFIAIAAAVAVFAASALLTSRLRLDEDITAMLPVSDPVVNDYRLVISRFRTIDAIFIDVGAASESPKAQELVAAAADALYERLAASGLFATIDYRISPERFMEGLGKLTESRFRLLSSGALPAVEARLSASEIRRRLADAKRTLLDPSGTFLRNQIRSDPLGINELVLSPLKGFASGGTAQVLDGRIWSADERHVLIVATPHIHAMDTRRSEPLMATFEGLCGEAVAAAPKDAVRISYVGGHRAALENAGTVKRDVKRSMLATSLGILLVGVLFFRRIYFIALIFLPAAFGVACATVGFALFDPLVSAVAFGCGAVLVGIAVDYGIYVLYRLENPEGEPLDPHACVRSVLLPLSMAVATTIGGLLCLLLSPLPGQRQTGLFAAVGILGSAVCAVLILPHVLPRKLREAFFPRRVVPLVSLCAAFLAWRARHRKALGLVLAVILVIGAIGLPRLRFEGRMEALNYMSAASREDSDLFKRVWGDLVSTTTSVVARGPDLQAALEANDHLLPVLADLEREGQIASLFSVGSLLPAGRTQAANLAHWRALWSGPRRAAMTAEIAKAAAELGFTPQAFQPFTDSLDADPPPLTLEAFAGSGGIGLDRLIRIRIAEEGGETLVLTTFTLKDDSQFPAVAARLRSASPDAVVMNGKAFAAHTTGLVRGELQRLALAAGIAMAFCLFVFLGRVELIVPALLPVCLSVAFTLGLLGLLGIPINLISSQFVVFVFGCGIDYSIFFFSSQLSRYRGSNAREASTCAAVAIAAMTATCGFATMVFAKHPALFSIGVTGTVGMLSSLVLGVLVAPGIAERLLPTDGRTGAPTLKTLGGGLWAYTYLLGMGLLYLCLVRPLVFLRHRRDLAARQRFARRYLHIMMVGLQRFFPYRDSDRIYLGADPKAFQPAGVIVSNHLAMFDILVVLALPAEMVMLVKGWVWKTPIVGQMLRDAGHLLMAQGDPEAFFARGAELLAQGVSVMVFPEATRSPDGRMHRFHKGAFELAVRTGCDVIPVLLSDTQACTPRKSFRIGDHRSVIRVLPRVTPATFDYAQGARALSAHVKQKLLELVDQDWRLAQQGRSFWHNLRSLYNYRGAYVERYVAWKLRLDPICRHVDDFVPQEGLVLDLGCGYGLMSNLLARRSLRRQVLGVDADERKIAVARATAAMSQNVTFELADLFQWQVPAADAVVLVDVLHYWELDGQRRLISRAAACLKEGGTMVFRDLCSPDTWRHRLVAWTERFATLSGQNRAGQGIHFGTRDFYLKAFAEEGLTLCAEPAHVNVGSNFTAVLRKGTPCHTT